MSKNFQGGGTNILGGGNIGNGSKDSSNITVDTLDVTGGGMLRELQHRANGGGTILELV